MQSTSRILPFPSGSAAPVLDALQGPSEAIAHIRSQIARVAPHFRAALVLGEPHTGALSVAEWLHRLSPLASRQFTTLTPQAAERCLTNRHTAEAVDGTLFLPEIESLSREAQIGLRRRMVVRGPRPIAVVAAAPNDLRPLVAAGTFSAELASTLRALRITLPPLRDRQPDLPILLQALIASRLPQAIQTDPGNSAALRLPADFLDHVAAQPWPGNLTQLSTAADWLVDHCDLTSLTPADLDAALAATTPEAPVLATPATRLIRLEQVVQEHIRGVLVACNGNKLRAAEVLGISRSTLYRMLDTNNAGFALAG